MDIEQEQKNAIKWYQDNITAIHQLARRDKQKSELITSVLFASIGLNVALALCLLMVI